MGFSSNKLRLLTITLQLTRLQAINNANSCTCNIFSFSGYFCQTFYYPRVIRRIIVKRAKADGSELLAGNLLQGERETYFYTKLVSYAGWLPNNREVCSLTLRLTDVYSTYIHFYRDQSKPFLLIVLLRKMLDPIFCSMDTVYERSSTLVPNWSLKRVRK